MLGLDEKRKFTNITFKDCSYNGKWLGSFADGDFLVNKFVENITFYLSHVKHLVSLTANSETAGSVSGDGFYTHGEKATVSATANAGYKFVCWTENKDTISVNTWATFAVTSDRHIKANFSPLTSSPSGLKNPVYFYPNPATDKLYINASGNAINKIELIDLTGKVVYTDKEVSQSKTIDLAGFVSGLYFVQVRTAENVSTTKVTINRN
jgi:hypothetical protein